MSRALNRRTCENPECKEIYNMRDNPPKVEGVCDNCGTQLIQRADDTEATAVNRLQVYDNQTAPLLEFYSKKNILKTVNGDQSLSKVFEDIKVVLGA